MGEGPEGSLIWWTSMFRPFAVRVSCFAPTRSGCVAAPALLCIVAAIAFSLLGRDALCSGDLHSDAFLGSSLRGAGIVAPSCRAHSVYSTRFDPPRLHRGSRVYQGLPASDSCLLVTTGTRSGRNFTVRTPPRAVPIPAFVDDRINTDSDEMGTAACSVCVCVCVCAVCCVL